MNNTLIAFSGACYSGKTTFMQMIKEKLGDDCLVLPEIIRELNIKSIDEVRKTDDYFNIQKNIITKKMEMEIEAVKNNNNKIILTDRSLVDSLYYFMMYVNNKNNFEEFPKLLSSIIEYIKWGIYNKIVVLEPLDVKDKGDPYRPDNILFIQRPEYEIIKAMICGFTDRNRVSVFNVRNLIKGQELIHFKNGLDYDFNEYSEYEDIVINRNFLLDNIYSNKFKSIDPTGLSKKTLLYSACLFSEDQEASNQIFDMVNEIRIEGDLMNSRCFPTGLFKKKNVMIVGEAPGRSGRGLNDTYLKPTFIFEKTSWMLRRAIEDLMDVPYITNLCKYASRENKVEIEDFERCRHIINYEIKAMEPSKIICLGRKAHSFMLENYGSQNISYVVHPAYCTYKNIGIGGYKRLWLQ
jgi:uracil-DNA glycosylase family 4